LRGLPLSERREGKGKEGEKKRGGEGRKEAVIKGRRGRGRGWNIFSFLLVHVLD